MHTWQDLINAWGGNARFGRHVGVKKAAADKMYSRNNVHANYWLIVVARAPHAGVDGVTLELLASLKRGRASVKQDRRFPGQVAAKVSRAA